MEKEREKNPKTEKSRINGDGHRQRGSDRHCSNKNQQTDGPLLQQLKPTLSQQPLLHINSQWFVFPAPCTSCLRDGAPNTSACTTLRAKWARFIRELRKSAQTWPAAAVPEGLLNAFKQQKMVLFTQWKKKKKPWRILMTDQQVPLLQISILHTLTEVVNVSAQQTRWQCPKCRQEALKWDFMKQWVTVATSVLGFGMTGLTKLWVTSLCQFVRWRHAQEFPATLKVKTTPWLAGGGSWRFLSLIWCNLLQRRCFLWFLPCCHGYL